MQVVVDNAGGYFRIQKPTGEYVNMTGEVPRPAIWTKGGKIKSVDLRQVDFNAYKRETHFSIDP
jgi:hypothetical protein